MFQITFTKFGEAPRHYDLHSLPIAIIDDQDGSMRSDLKVLVDTDGKPLWDGKSAIEVREATAAQHAEWEQSRDQAIRDDEIDLDAGTDSDEWSVYLMSAPHREKGRRTK
jgi:hypothetical protein